ncbi:LAQU0S07e02014g1_1 [Lachancea quebecensis]|uniref:LAQU0S07e02014g1_1 n=1 Tax=Lachancea quebecensis TaxID=1654605 RepID=A0A0P1KUR2_9SACH|nr:LAQU0S07e02014g1_1 [Lachancea quebecensis]
MNTGPQNFGRKEPNRAQLRSQLLSNDLGTIDVAQERPINQAAPPQYPMAPVYNNAYQPQQLPYGQPPFQPGRASFVQQGYQAADQRRPSLHSQSAGGKRSLQSNAISGLFKMRNGKSKSKDSDEEEDTFMTDGDSSILTFSDISSMRNNGGHKYGFGGAMDDTSPIIPTLVTKGHENMNNVEYRKHLAAQKKMAMNALSKQNKPIHQMPPQGGPRTMSLQHSYNPYGAQVPPRNNFNQGPPYARANSMMSGPPPQMRYPNARGTPPPPGAGAPRAMSLTNSRRNMANPHGSFRPQTAALGARPASPYVGGQPSMPYQGPRPNNMMVAPDGGYQTQDVKTAALLSNENVTPHSSSSLVSSNSLSSHRPSSQTPESQNADDPSTASKLLSGPVQKLPGGSPLSSEANNMGKLNIIKLSDPQQELRHKEQYLQERERLLAEKEEKLRARERKAQEQKESNAAIEKQQPLNTYSSVNEQSPQFRLSRQTSDPQVTQPNSGRIGSRSQVQSMATFESSLSNDSPVKKRDDKTGLYMLDNGTEGNAYFTASDLLNEEASRLHENLSEVTITNDETGSKQSVNSFGASNKVQDETEGKAAGMGKARKFFKRLSSSGAKSTNSVTNSRKSSMSSIRRASSSDSVIADRRASADGKRNWSVKSDSTKRRSFHSLFSNSSIGLNSTEPLKPHTGLTNIEEKRVRDISASEEHKMSPEAPGPASPVKPLRFDSTLRRSDTSVEASGKETNRASEGDAHGEENAGDEFVFDNSVGQTYKPAHASESELGAASELNPKSNSRTSMSGSQVSMLNEQNTLMNEINLLSKELAESIARESRLEQQLAGKGKDSSEYEALSISDFEVELRKKSTKIVELIQQLNDERLRRYIAEEQVMLQEHGAKPSSVDLIHKIQTQNQQILARDEEISKLKEQLQNAHF